MGRLKDKVVLITGASAGIGKACAQLFAEEGCKLILCARRVEKLKELEKSLSKYNVKIFIFKLDVSDINQVKALKSSIPKEMQEIDVLVNNAGLALGMAHAHENDLNDVKIMMDTNFMGIANMTTVFVPDMKKRKRGTIINVGSISGFQPYPGGSVYCGSKFAVKGFTDAMRMELVGTGVRVCHIAPGLVKTEFSEVRFKGDLQKAEKVYQNIVTLDPMDVADTIVYCASRPDHVQLADVIMFSTSQASNYHTFRT